MAEATQRPTLRFVPMKTIEPQARPTIHRLWEGFKKARTARVNQRRGVLAEDGWVIKRGGCLSASGASWTMPSQPSSGGQSV